MTTNLLYITHINPFIFSDATSLRVHHLIKMFSKLGSVVCISIIPKEQHAVGDTKLANKICKAYFKWERLSPQPIRSFLSWNPTETKSFYSKIYLDQILQIIKNHNINCIWLDHIYFTDYFYSLQGLDIPIIFGTHNIESEVYLDKCRLNTSLPIKIKYYLKYKLTRHLEEKLARENIQIVCVSERDRAYYANLNTNLKTYAINSCINLDFYQTAVTETLAVQQRPMLLYTGLLKYEATYDAVLFFYRDIMPYLDKILPQYTFYVVGKDPVKEVKALAGNKVVVTGYVESTLPYFRAADVFVVPLRFGSGTRLKILEAMATSVPIVTTSKGCEGLDVVDGEHVLIADSPKEFAEKIVQIWKDAKLRKKLAENARELIQSKYDWRSLEIPLRELLTNVTRVFHK